jgi:hypothetical protein
MVGLVRSVHSASDNGVILGVLGIKDMVGFDGLLGMVIFFSDR